MNIYPTDKNSPEERNKVTRSRRQLSSIEAEIKSAERELLAINERILRERKYGISATGYEMTGPIPCKDPSTWDNILAFALERNDNRYSTCEWDSPSDEAQFSLEQELLVNFQLRFRRGTGILEDMEEEGDCVYLNCHEGFYVLDRKNDRIFLVSKTLLGVLKHIKLDDWKDCDGYAFHNAGRPFCTHERQSFVRYGRQSDPSGEIARMKNRLRGKVMSILQTEDYKNVSSWDGIIERVDLRNYVALKCDEEWDNQTAEILLKNFGIRHKPNTEFLFGTRSHDLIAYCSEGIFTISKDMKSACLISRTLTGALKYLGLEEGDPEGEDKAAGTPYFEVLPVV